MLDWLFGRKKEEPAPQKSNKSSEEQEAQDKWKYDFIVQFLSGPLWKTSLLDFVDYNCVVFDTQQQNKFEYTTIHNKFKELVASLFDGMMQEVGLDDDKLAQLLQKGFDSKHKKIFNQLLLADDFMKFKQLMVNRNKTLEAQAVKALHESHSKVVEKKKKQKKIITQQQLLRQSKLAEQQRLRKIQQEQEEQLRKAIELSKIESQEQNMIRKLEEKVANSEVKQQPPKNVHVQVKQQPLKLPIPEPIVQKPEVQQRKLVPPPIQQPPPVQQKPKKNLPSLQPLPPLKNQKKVEEPQIIQSKPQEVKKQVAQQKHQPQHTEVQSQEDRKKRLMQQRERIRRKKQEERKKEMAEEQKKPVQTIVLQEDGIHETNIAAVQDKKVSMTQIERRRELMKKIKNRIVDDF